MVRSKIGSMPNYSPQTPISQYLNFLISQYLNIPISQLPNPIHPENSKFSPEKLSLSDNNSPFCTPLFSFDDLRCAYPPSYYIHW